MKPKTIVTTALLAFVVASVGFMVVKELKDRGKRAASTGGPDQTDSAGPSHRVIAYYFHGNVRCDNCRKIEAYSQEAVLTGFEEALDAGRLEWLIVNVDEPENEHFTKDYELVTRSVVLVEIRDGKRVRWKNLEQVWQLLGQKGVFIDYVRNEVKAYLEGTG